MHRSHFIALPALFVASLASAEPSQTIDFNDAPPTTTMCGDIVNANLYNDQSWFFSSDVFECLQSVPFYDAVATRFIDYINQTLQMQSTLAYLKAPPSSYQQPSIDLIGGLQDIQDKVNAKAFHNQYAFETSVNKLLLAAHDAHLSLYAGVSSTFTFASPYDIVSVSEDGKKAPKIYFYDDLSECVSQSDCQPAAIQAINGVPAADFLTDFARSQAIGLLEPHADWNSLMRSAALDIQGGLATFSGAASIYPGDALTFEFENGTTLDSRWVALYNSPGYTGPLATGGDFYNFFVLNEAPASYNATEYYDQLDEQDGNAEDEDQSADTDDQSANLTSWNSISAAYPSKTLVYQDQLDLYQSGILTGYIFDDISTAVLSIPSFNVYGDGVDSFSSTIVNFINNSSQAQRVIIDLQQNSGGLAGLAFDTFRLFFPSLIPYAGSRMRASPYSDALGSSYTHFFHNLTVDDERYADYIGSEWVITPRINARNNHTFASWSQFFGPLFADGDFHTLTQRYNLTDQDFNGDAFGLYFAEGAFNTSFEQPQAPWNPEDIVILTDGLCSSTCSLFVEMMTAVEGVRTVVVGGAPKAGPMQIASGSRGAAAYSGAQIDNDIDFARRKNSTSRAVLPPRGNQTDTGMSVTFAGINLRDQIRDDSTTPNQFLYMPADCRIYWTLTNFFNYEQLWRDAHSAIYNDTTLCVPGSQDAMAPTVKRLHVRDVQASTSSMGKYIMDAISGDNQAGEDTPSPEPIIDGQKQSSSKFPKSCFNKKLNAKDHNMCDNGLTCMEVESKCRNCTLAASDAQCQKSEITQDKSFLCLKKCQLSTPGNCAAHTGCVAAQTLNGKKNVANGKNQPSNTPKASSGFCYPDDHFKSSNPLITCAQLNRNRAAYQKS